MVERRVTVVNSHGIHARPAAEIVKTAARFASNITLVRDDLEVNGKSIMGVMMLAAECGAELVIRADGDDAEQAVEALAALIAGHFGEA
jgi:phosphocarrier protein HPr